MRTFSKLVLLCNICFVLAVVLRLVENSKRKVGDFSGAIPIQPLENTLVVLGYFVAIVLNAVFTIQMLYFFITKKEHTLSPWIVRINLLMFPIQIWYFFYL
jgi:hypothetical protein